MNKRAPIQRDTGYNAVRRLISEVRKMVLEDKCPKHLLKMTYQAEACIQRKTKECDE